jgi:transcriptional regulator with XRE-family HTH domain
MWSWKTLINNYSNSGCMSGNIPDLTLAIIGARLKALRISQNIQQNELAEEIKCDNVLIHRLESGKGASVEILFDVLNYYIKKNIKVHYIFSPGFDDSWLKDDPTKEVVVGQINQRIDQIMTNTSKELILLKEMVKLNLSSKKKTK